eukprot:gnl/TRDRNA2_/TRDRNA2_179800_c0_seq1.p1 gnl/TRDRNA2_/TRDRNA2_179800_c0~~gnl/TRDRNA2_/TRDRNA2_179800_c0_seq1.p1  ORF type:complete len:266 (-),score=85.70 gnl/TRDRNA2_/TRDRNA2_179800_c0_seq1:67-864(-)
MAVIDDGYDEMEGPTDPMDLLLASTEPDPSAKPRILDFVRVKMKELRAENAQLKERIVDLEQTLQIVQSAQAWALEKELTEEQARKFQDIQALLTQAKRAKEEMANFTTAGRTALYEKLRFAKNALKKEKEEKREMKERLIQALDHMRQLKAANARVQEKQAAETRYWQDVIQNLKEKHKRQLTKLQGAEGAEYAQRDQMMSTFGEAMMDELSQLQRHVAEVKTETVDKVLLEGDEEIDMQGAFDPDADVDENYIPPEKRLGIDD